MPEASPAAKSQMRRMIERSIRIARNPDPREKIMKKRAEKAKIVIKKYGL
jgi:hypothetical protein